MNQKTIITLAVIAAAGAAAFYFYKEHQRKQALLPVERVPQNGNPNATNNGLQATVGAVGSIVKTVGDVYDRFANMEKTESAYGGY